MADRYVAGDSVLSDGVRKALAEHQPDIVVLNTGDARMADGSSILMNADDLLQVHKEHRRRASLPSI